MDSLTDYRIFVQVMSAGSLSAAGRELGLSPAVISKRLSRLEERLGVRLLHRSTRHVAPTEIGEEFHDRIVAAVAALDEAESVVSSQMQRPVGQLKISVPTSFSRLHVAPLLKPFLDENPGLRVYVDVSDSFVDVVANSFDIAIRIMKPADSGLVARRLAPNRRILCATPAYLARAGTPRMADDLAGHALLAASNQAPWRMTGPEGEISIRPDSVIQTNSSEIIRQAVFSGLGIGFRSTWDVSEGIADGRLVRVLPDHMGGQDHGIYAVFSSRKFVPAKIRSFVDFLVRRFGPEPYWDRQIAEVLGLPATAGEGAGSS
ncbi:MAG TPA: LysR family transcriptional regulator [Sphingomonadaceae bacterium]|nr:LysR family transcriptional regulator [Sphingomonadaceae bacterium]